MFVFDHSAKRSDFWWKVLVMLSEEHPVIPEKHFQRYFSSIKFYTHFWNGAKNTSNFQDNFSARVVKLHGTCPGLHFREEALFGKEIFHNEFQTPSGKFWQGNQNCLLRVQGICWGKRDVLKRFFCSFFRTFSVDVLDLRQTFWQVVRTVKNLSRVVLEEFFFGDMAQYVYISTWIFNKKLYFSHSFSEWLSKVHSTFLREQF